MKRKQVLSISELYENITDIVGARIICWFVDDCSGILKSLQRTDQLTFIPDSVENFIEKPKETGYRSIHILNELEVDNLGLDIAVTDSFKKIISEIQIRTKLQDSWAEITHEFHYKAKYAGIDNSTYESLLGDISERLALEDKTMMKFRDAYRKLANRNNKITLLSSNKTIRPAQEKVAFVDAYSEVDSSNNIYEIYTEVSQKNDMPYLAYKTSRTS